MATKFRILRAPADANNDLAERANRAMAEVEAAGGRYLESHSSMVESPGMPMICLVIVYDDGAIKPGAQR